MAQFCVEEALAERLQYVERRVGGPSEDLLAAAVTEPPSPHELAGAQHREKLAALGVTG